MNRKRGLLLCTTDNDGNKKAAEALECLLLGTLAEKRFDERRHIVWSSLVKGHGPQMQILSMLEPVLLYYQ